MRLESRGLPVVMCIVFLAAGAWLVGCGVGGADPSAIFFRSGLLNIGLGANPAGGALPSPGQDQQQEEDTGNGDGGGEEESVCIVFFNNSDQDARVDLFANASTSIQLEQLTASDNLVSLPQDDQGCIPSDQLDPPANEIRPLILDNGQLSFQIDCTAAGSLAFGAMDENGLVLNEDDIFGPLHQGTEFNCGDTIEIEITDQDQDEELEIGF